MGIGVLAQVTAFTIPIALETPRVEPVTWEELTRYPDARMQETVEVRLSKHSMIEDWEPYHTRFSPEDYVAVRAWSDDQEIWFEEVFGAPKAVVFARRGSRAEEVLTSAERHDRLALACVPQCYQAGYLWIEATEACTTRAKLTEGATLHVERALDLIERDAPRMAEEQLVRALAGQLPKATRRELEKLLEDCAATRVSE